MVYRVIAAGAVWIVVGGTAVVVPDIDHVLSCECRER
ncbi:hypothetical protein F4559_003915 [Saccharothrix violaceirubra]|uniref:Uncharacterized protein n=1 Tax=Saccharothrix violaceirubra TaxID=413306 RepID=A0A7W7WWX6_9PSEU|nr:hypothetical protein [Saccharothrix violaceirubra]